MKTKQILSAITALLVITVMLLPACCAAGSVVINQTVNISNARQNVHGSGYEWENIPDILTLDGVNINTKDDYGIKLPANCTVVLKGDNYIKAGKYGISCAGKTLFKGSGTLTIDAGEIGIYLYSQDSTTKVQIMDGRYTVNAGKYGVYSEYSDFSVSGGKIDVSVSDGRAILGRNVNLVGGTFSADSSVEASQNLTVDSINLSISSSDRALCAGKLYIRNVTASHADEYNGEKEIEFSADERWHKTSIIFGDSVPGWIDYLLLAAVLAIVVLCIAVPVMKKKKKKKELYEKLVREGYLTEEEAKEKLGAGKE